MTCLRKVMHRRFLKISEKVHPHGIYLITFSFIQKSSINRGCDLTNSLTGVLTRLSAQPIAIMADIEKMFYQLRVPTEDSRYLRFRWWPSGDVVKEPGEFQMLVYLYGGVSSPSCPNYALQKTADNNAEYFDKDTIQTVRTNFYVDGCLKSVEDNRQARWFQLNEMD